jgi:ABC-type glutathione transport system ATPase component
MRSQPHSPPPMTTRIRRTADDCHDRGPRPHEAIRKDKALDGMGLSAQRGQVTAVLGPNGAGETTFVRSRYPSPSPSIDAANPNTPS